MKIGIVTAWFSGGGAAEVSLSFARVLLRQGQEVSIYARFEESGPFLQFQHEGFDVHIGTRTSSPLIKSVNLRDFKRWLTKNHIDVVIFNEQVDLSPVVLAKHMGIKCVAYVDYYREDTVQLFEIYDGLICVTARHYEVFKWHRESWYLPWGIDEEIYRDAQYDDTYSKYPYFHSCSADPIRKGTDILIKAMLLNSELRCVIHAYPELVSKLPELRSQIEYLKASQQLVEINRLVRQPGLYKYGRFFVYPSRLDGLGLSVLEAQAHGLFIITTNTPPMSEFLIPNASIGVPPTRFRSRADGYYWPIAEMNPQDLADAMIQATKLNGAVETSELIKRHVKSRRDLFVNFANLSTLIKEMEFSPLQKQLERAIAHSHFQKVPFRYQNIFVEKTLNSALALRYIIQRRSTP